MHEGPTPADLTEAVQRLCIPRPARRQAILTMAAMAATVIFPHGAHADPTPGLSQSESTRYRVLQHATDGVAPSGWGFSATVQGRSVDLQARGLQWVDDPGARPGDAAAGFGWRGDGSSMVVGYQQRGAIGNPAAFAPRRYGEPASDSSGVLGFSFTVRPK